MRTGLAWILAGLVAALGIGWGVVAHFYSASNDRSGSSYAFALASAFALAVLLVWPSRWRWAGVATAALAVASAWAAIGGAGWDPRWIYLVQHAGAHAALGVVFGHTLRHGRVALVTRFALIDHGKLPQPLVTYTRQVTWAWTLYFAAMTAASLVLFALHPYAWSLLANILTLPLLGAMFVGEYAIRRVRFRDFPHVSILAGIRAGISIGRRR